MKIRIRSRYECGQRDPAERHHVLLEETDIHESGEDRHELERERYRNEKDIR